MTGGAQEARRLRPVIVGSFGPPTLACLRSWRRAGFCPSIVTFERAEVPAVFEQSTVVLPRAELLTDAGVARLATSLHSLGPCGVAAISEALWCWLSDHRAALPEGTQFWGPPSEVARRVLSKAEQNRVARQVGLSVLPSWELSGPGEVGGVGPEAYPLCLRPSEPGTAQPGFKVRLATSADETRGFLSNLERLDAPVVAQPFKPLPNLVVHGARSLAGETLGLQGFLVERKFEGVTLTIRPSAIGPDLAARCAAFTDAFGLVGNYHFEFLLDAKTGEAWFLELNARFGGTTAKVYACGYDEPMLALKAFGIDGWEPRPLRPVTVTSRWALLKYLGAAARNRLGPLDFPEEPCWRRVAAALWGLVTWKDDVWDWRDLRGSLGLYGANLRGKMTRRGGREAGS